MNLVSQVEYGDFFERRGREGFAESAKEVKEKNTKLRKYKIENSYFFDVNLKTFEKSFFSGFPFLPSFLRPLRNLRALCAQKLPVFLALRTNHPSTGATTQ